MFTETWCLLPANGFKETSSTNLSLHFFKNFFTQEDEGYDPLASAFSEQDEVEKFLNASEAHELKMKEKFSDMEIQFVNTEECIKQASVMLITFVKHRTQSANKLLNKVKAK